MDNEETASNANKDSGIHAGMRLPHFQRTGHPSPLSITDQNRLVDLANLIPNVTVKRSVGAGTTATARWVVSNTNIVLELIDAATGTGGGSVNVVACRVVSEQSEYVTCQPIQYSSDGVYSDTSDPQILVAKPFSVRGNSGATISPKYIQTPAQILLALQDPTGGTGVYVGGEDVGYQDVNIDNRRLTEVDYFNIHITSGILDMHPDYWVGVSTTTSATVAIAKNQSLRNSITTETIDSVVYAYTYQTTGTFAFVTRRLNFTLNGVAQQEFQVIVPRYLSTSIIKARRMATGINDLSSNPILWQEESGREWAARASQNGFEGT
jgi:hypothetical protein